MNPIDRDRVEGGSAGHLRAGGPHFLGRLLDDAPHLLAQSYRLRYEVYCLERKFLRAEDYPTGLEIDQFDCHSLHVGAIDAAGDLAGTSRAVKVSELGLPLFEHCSSFPHETEFHGANPRLVEVGRLVVGPRYRRRRTDLEGKVENASKPTHATEYHGVERRRVGADAFMTILNALYQATRHTGATHWLTAMEESLRNQLERQGFPFRAFGPESEYYGTVAPYQMALKEFEAVIQSGRFPRLDAFVAGDEPGVGAQPYEGAERRSHETVASRDET